MTGVIVLILSAAIQLLCPQHDRPKYRVPLFPYLPAASLLLNCFLMASLTAQAYWQLAIFFAVMIIFYLLYSVHAAARFEQETGVSVGSKAVDLENPAESVKDVGVGVSPAASQDSMNRNASLIDRVNTGPGSRIVLGRRSAGITRLPPPTL